MVKLTAELIQSTVPFLNPLKDRELELRGLKIPAIENLGVTKDQLDAIDLSSNALHLLSNFPNLPRLKTLNLASNPISSISPSIPTSLPNLTVLILTTCSVPMNGLGQWGEVLGKLRKLEVLSMEGNPVVAREGYREFMIYKCKSLRTLDWRKIGDKERKLVRSKLLTPEGQPTPLLQSITSTVATSDPLALSAMANSTTARTFEPGVPLTTTAAAGSKGSNLTEAEKKRIRAAIEAATSVEEIRRLEGMLGMGMVPDVPGQGGAAAAPAATATAGNKGKRKADEMEDAEETAAQTVSETGVGAGTGTGTGEEAAAEEANGGGGKGKGRSARSKAGAGGKKGATAATKKGGGATRTSKRGKKEEDAAPVVEEEEEEEE